MNVQVNLANMEAYALAELTATRAVVLEDTREVHVERVSRIQVYPALISIKEHNMYIMHNLSNIQNELVRFIIIIIQYYNIVDVLILVLRYMLSLWSM